MDAWSLLRLLPSAACAACVWVCVPSACLRSTSHFPAFLCRTPLLPPPQASRAALLCFQRQLWHGENEPGQHDTPGLQGMDPKSVRLEDLSRRGRGPYTGPKTPEKQGTKCLCMACFPVISPLRLTIISTAVERGF